jgi:lipopolysaccharide export system permease protein
MRIIDRYIIKKFLAILFYTTMAFIVIFVVVDLIENLDKFLSSEAKFLDVVLYYIYFIPYIILLTLPVNMLLSCLFSLGSMAQYNELISCLSAGVSLYRIVLPILILAAIISVASGVAGETVVPETNRRRMDIFRYDIRKQPRMQGGTQRQISLQDRGGRQLSIEYFDARKQKAEKVNIVWREGNTIRERWDVKSMVWDTSRSEWKLNQVIQRKFTDTGEEISEHDLLWYQDSQVFPEDLVDLQVKPEEMNYVELNRFVDKMLSLGADARKWLVELYMKISYPFANFIIVLFGAPLASRKRRSGPALGFALALLISFVYFLFVRSGQVLGRDGTLDPLLGAWIGNIVFGIGGILLMLRVRK